MSNKDLFLSLIVIIIGSWCLVEGKQYRACKDKPTGTILPHPLGCKHYIKCSKGVANAFYCPEGTLYSAANPPCEEAARANCTDSAASSTLTTSFEDTTTPLKPTKTTAFATLETSKPPTTTFATIATTRTSSSTNEVNSSRMPSTRTSTRRTRRTRTTSKTTQATVNTMTPATIETSTEASSTNKPILNQLERGIKCPDNETADDVAFVPSNMNCTK